MGCVLCVCVCVMISTSNGTRFLKIGTINQTSLYYFNHVKVIGIIKKGGFPLIKDSIEIVCLPGSNIEFDFYMIILVHFYTFLYLFV